ncbi:hypothetical protein U8P73_31155 (plasmid) [Rhizobium beringeri]|uniref:hypothetical protein n=1 Tax=Rhizobium beringeri TaxID=3019934 RepID=UPI002DDC9F83|nr:hypothetical protein [Rhizobium beringeri]WSG92833.1 hypothetical protein U8P73_31155 [Rhizobium beringeri]
MNRTDPSPTGVAPRSPAIEWINPRRLDLDTEVARYGLLDFGAVLRSRRTTRRLEKATLPQVAAVVREALKADFIGTGSHEGRKRKRVISAGALHPVKCVLIDPDEGAIYYDDENDVFVAVQPRNQGLLGTYLAKCEDVLPTARGHVIGLIADVRDLSSVYTDHQSLLWRDAGAVLQTLALTSEASSLGFCPLGILGQELADALLADQAFVAVGAAVIGRRAQE